MFRTQTERNESLIHNKKISYDNAVNPLVQVVSSKLQLTEGLLQKTAEEQGASEAVGDKLVYKAVSLLDSMGALVDR